ncbi:septum site-determining protein MinC [Natroniella acetigena]|uniref:septum site-determining protein MinC n=1 Tax=Natroniella acetigena TaxID=52004 RepID=UPI00200A1A0C|nr:septum site-determining protein MinC [Natroniella acetigena]MCK8828225.1 septum site-determining protein MinC [Natroniella acetigena]
MGSNGVVFKGDLEGLIIILDDQLDFSKLIAELKDKFERAGNFFNDDLIARIKLGTRSLSITEKKKLVEVFKKELDFSVIEFINDETNFKTSQQEDTLLIKRTIRSGQSVSFAGNIVIQGDVNPGAEVVAGGDIIVMGVIRGIAHCGVNGKGDATISAFRLEPTQLRIADHISRAPDGFVNSPDTPEIAYIKDGKIEIDYLRK